MLMGKVGFWRRLIARLLLAVILFACVPPSSLKAENQPVAEFSFNTVRDLARALAAKEYRAPDNKDLPDELKKLNFDQYQSIRFRPEHTIWKGQNLRFTVQFSCRGYLYQDPVKIHFIENGHVSDMKFATALFDFGTNHEPKDLSPDLEFAGFRLLYPLNSPQKDDEVMEFLGASYFRSLGARQRYGASIRGLAVNTAESGGEEFPRFTEFWIEKPPPLAGGVRVFALMDSPSVAGAYRFVIQPGNNTLTEIEESLFFRNIPKKIGLAPLGSLFLQGQTRTHLTPDYRPQVHDSDGLLIETSDTNWLWRPLVNPTKTFQTSDYPMTDMKGFGLLQRDREFSDYDDLQSRFELKSSYWVEPTGNWGPGAVELVEIPTPNDWNDNIVAYWKPKEMPGAGQELHLTYRVSALLNGPDIVPALRVRSTHIRPESNGRPPRFVVDYGGTPPHPVELSANGAVMVQSSNGQVKNLVVQTNDATGGWQAVFDLEGSGEGRTELRMRLLPGARPVGETWIYDYQKSN
ncbi:MAG TPA: glucan biosynthesis protein G [Verrucomicrobiae bacterium]